MKRTTLLSVGLVVAGGCLAASVAWSKPPFPVPPKGGLPKCQANVAECRLDLGFCEAELATCEATEVQAFPATGQEACWDTVGAIIDCEDTGHDGDIQAGATMSFTDNGDGTVTDDNTKLMWEKKDSLDDPVLPGPSNPLNQYTWAEALNNETQTGFLYALNRTCNGDGMQFCSNEVPVVPCPELQACGLAGHTDWRVPNVKELISIWNYGKGSARPDPRVIPDFNPNSYWTSTTFENQTNTAWGIDAAGGPVFFGEKSSELPVVGVRGGL